MCVGEDVDPLFKTSCGLSDVNPVSLGFVYEGSRTSVERNPPVSVVGTGVSSSRVRESCPETIVDYHNEEDGNLRLYVR